MKMKNKLTGKHGNSHSQYLSGVCSDLKGMLSNEKIPMTVILTKDYFRQESLKSQFCPDCESKDLIYYGKSPEGTQKHKCKLCFREFVSQVDSILPESSRLLTYEREFLKNKEKYNYWDNSFYLVVNFLESHKGHLMISKKLKYSFNNMIRDKKEFDVFVFVIFHEAYNIVMAR